MRIDGKTRDEFKRLVIEVGELRRRFAAIAADCCCSSCGADRQRSILLWKWAYNEALLLYRSHLRTFEAGEIIMRKLATMQEISERRTTLTYNSVGDMRGIIYHV